MIFPILKGLLPFQNAPVTWCLVFLNIFMMTLSSAFDATPLNGLSTLVKDKSFIEIQGSIYQSYLREKEGHRIHRELSSLVDEESRRNFQVLGVLAFKDKGFLESDILDTQYVDEVAYSYWKEKIKNFQENQAFSYSRILGVSSYNNSVSSWLSYMFAHGSWTHLFSNMIFLIIVGGSLELLLGGLGVLTIYILSGLIACAVYILSSGLSAAPLIGASGAVSGLITLYSVLYWRVPSRFFYWLIIPTRNTIGFVYLPGFFIFFMWMVADLAGYFASSTFSGGVAHSAHLGGHLAGFVAGLTVLFILKKRVESETPPEMMFKLFPLMTPLISRFLPRGNSLLP